MVRERGGSKWYGIHNEFFFKHICVTGITAGNSVTLRWTISNGSCTSSTDDVVLTNNNNPTANAGSDVITVVGRVVR